MTTTRSTNTETAADAAGDGTGTAVPSSPAPAVATISDDDLKQLLADGEDDCPNCGGSGWVESCFEDTCVCVDPPCHETRCDWCSPRRPALTDAEKLRAQIPSSTDPARLERMAQKAEARTADREPFDVRCGDCGHQWAPLNLPMEMAKWCKIMRTMRCPMCAAPAKRISVGGSTPAPERRT